MLALQMERFIALRLQSYGQPFGLIKINDSKFIELLHQMSVQK